MLVSDRSSPFRDVDPVYLQRRPFQTIQFQRSGAFLRSFRRLLGVGVKEVGSYDVVLRVGGAEGDCTWREA